MFRYIQNIQKNRGMTYVELIVVLAIFAIMTSVVLFNYKSFQGAVDIKNLANDVALKLVQAQKDSVSGTWNSAAAQTWKPAYGVYFDVTTPTQFVYFADLDNSGGCNTAGCTPPSYSVGGEVLNIFNITKGNSIPVSGLEVNGTGCPPTVGNLSIVFKRPSSLPTITSSTSLVGCTITYVTVDVSSPQGVISKIKLYASGRIQIN